MLAADGRQTAQRADGGCGERTVELRTPMEMETGTEDG
uniref:Uncharacterized protein n=1 Tax=Cucumis melo TaxID=3656 RepID=A0A9I9E452_CUCME